MPEPSNMTPSSIEIRVEEMKEVVINGCKEYTFYVNGQEYKKMPLDANVREPDTKKSKPYKDMINTLADHPENFFENNLGISIIASQVTEIGKKKYKLKFDDGTGILNGGHTQQAILDSKKNPNISNAIVRLTVRVKNYTKRRIAEIAASQNSSTAVKEYSLAEKRGLFVDLKKRLEPNIEKHIIWWEGKDVAANIGMEPVDLIAILNVFNIKLYSSEYSSFSSQPTGSATGKASVLKKWENEENIESYRIIYPLANDILRLCETIQCHFWEGSGMSALNVIKEQAKKPLIFSDEICQYGLPKQLLFPLLAAYRANVFYDEQKRTIGWYEDNMELFRKYNKELCASLKSSLKSHGNEANRVAKDPTIWQNLYITLRDHINKKGKFKIYDI